MGWVSMEATARRVDRYRWVELRSFEVLGGWVTSAPEPEVKRLLAAHGHQHAWHAQLWRDRRPEVAEFVELPAGAALDRFVAAMAEPDSTVERLAGVYQVLLPRLIAAYTEHRALLDELTDAPTVRTLGLVLADEQAACRDGELLLQSLLVTPDDVRRAAEHVSLLEALMIEAGGVAGDSEGIEVSG